jgi:DNA-binding CsgD family transcriptional regulator
MQQIRSSLEFPFEIPDPGRGGPGDIRVVRKAILIDPDARRRAVVSHELHEQGYFVNPFDSAAELAGYLPSEGILIIADEGDLIASVVAVLRAGGLIQPFFTYAASLVASSMMNALRNGAFEYVLWPDEKGLLFGRIESEARRRHFLDHINGQRGGRPGDPSISDEDYAILEFVGKGLPMRDAPSTLAISYAQAHARAVALMHMLDAQNFAQALETASLWRDFERELHDEARKARAKFRIERLSAREREVLKAIAQGLSSKEAASVLGISNRTVETHRTSIFAKVEVRNLAEATHLAIFGGLV